MHQDGRWHLAHRGPLHQRPGEAPEHSGRRRVPATAASSASSGCSSPNGRRCQPPNTTISRPASSSGSVDRWRGRRVAQRFGGHGAEAEITTVYAATRYCCQIRASLPRTNRAADSNRVDSALSRECACRCSPSFRVEGAVAASLLLCDRLQERCERRSCAVQTPGPRPERASLAAESRRSVVPSRREKGVPVCPSAT